MASEGAWSLPRFFLSYRMWSFYGNLWAKRDHLIETVTRVDAYFFLIFSFSHILFQWVFYSVVLFQVIPDHIVPRELYLPYIPGHVPDADGKQASHITMLV